VAAEEAATVLVAVMAVAVVDGRAVAAVVAADLRGANRAGRNTTLG